MEVKRCDRCGSIIEKENTYMEIRADKVLQTENGRSRNTFDIYGDLCEDCMNELKEFMKGKEEPKTETPEEAPAEAKETSKFVDMVLQVREMMKWCDEKNNCEKCPLYELNEDEDLICGGRCVYDFVRKFIIEAAHDPIVQHLVLNKLDHDKEIDAFHADDALEDKAYKLSKKLYKKVVENDYSDVYKMEEEPEESESKRMHALGDAFTSGIREGIEDATKESEKPVIEVHKVDFNEVMKDQELHDLFWLSLILGLAHGMGDEGQEDE